MFAFCIANTLLGFREKCFKMTAAWHWNTFSLRLEKCQNSLLADVILYFLQVQAYWIFIVTKNILSLDMCYGFKLFNSSAEDVDTHWI